ncbi:MAG: hypothetical protein BGO63_04745 [Candidatus Accumulibacter sp. 66-26]|nr:Mth938-like domain-containing protein [Accumulibacter sp.]OJW48436.1 MAG: hypothetical protein BGO63_04745 [Candidatus Accumulibacter sp. 66-26]
MKLQNTPSDGQNAFTGYGDGYVGVNGARFTSNIAVSPDRLIPNWTQASFDTLSVADFEFLAGMDAEIILLGTGKQIRFPRPELLRPLIEAGKGLEVMDLQAACRTYNILHSEGRKVAAALLFS